MEPMEEVIEPVKAAKPKRTAKKTTKPKKAKAKSKPKAKKAPKKKAVKSKAKKATKPKKTSGTVIRSERLDMRLSKPEKASIMAVCKKTSRTYTSVALEALRLGLPKVRAAR